MSFAGVIGMLCSPASACVAVTDTDAEIGALIAEAKAEGTLAIRIDLESARDKEALLSTIGKTLRFPDWFGANWDALTDCLGDMGWQPAEHYLLVFTGGNALAEKSGDVLSTLVSILQDACDEWRERGAAFSALIVLPDGVAQKVVAELPRISLAADK